MANPSIQQRFLTQHYRHPGLQSDRRIRKHISKLLILLGLLVLGHTGAMIWLEGMSAWSAFWLTLTTITTVGYGDVAAQSTEGQMATVLLMYMAGITLLTLIVSDIVDYRIARRERIRTGFWNWNMTNHIVIMNSPVHNASQYFTRLVQQLREHPDFKDMDVLLLNTQFAQGLPSELVELGINHVTGSASQPKSLALTHLEQARFIVVLAKNEYDPESDASTFDIAHRLHEQQWVHKSIVEVVDDGNRDRFKKLGIRSLIRPIRSYPEMIVRAMDAPGSELLIEDLFTRAQDHPKRFPVWIEGEKWSEVVGALVDNNLGTPMAYVTKDGQVVIHPRGDERIHAQSLILLVKADDVPEVQEIHFALQNARLGLVSVQEHVTP